MGKSIKIISKLKRIENYLKQHYHENKQNDGYDIKNRQENDNGYISIYYFRHKKSGCVVRIHHWIDNTLSIDLLISERAGNRYADICESAIEKFKNLFDEQPQHDSNFLINNKPKPYNRYWFDITTEYDEKIFSRLEKIIETLS